MIITITLDNPDEYAAACALRDEILNSDNLVVSKQYSLSYDSNGPLIPITEKDTHDEISTIR